MGLRVDTICNLGSYLSAFAVSVPTYLHGTLLSGVYDIPAIYTNVKGMATTTAPVDAYRGAGRPEATYLLERTMDIQQQVDRQRAIDEQTNRQIKPRKIIATEQRESSSRTHIMP